MWLQFKMNQATECPLRFQSLYFDFFSIYQLSLLSSTVVCTVYNTTCVQLMSYLAIQENCPITRIRILVLLTQNYVIRHKCFSFWTRVCLLMAHLHVSSLCVRQLLCIRLLIHQVLKTFKKKNCNSCIRWGIQISTATD